MLRNRLMRILEPAIEALGYELVAMDYIPGLKTATLRLYIDKLEGVTMEDCEITSREIAALLDVEDPIDKAYQLEVSSPGLDRLLVKKEHYLRFVGEKARIQTLAAIDRRKRFIGVIVSADDVSVEINMDDKLIRIPYVDIDKARLVPDYAKEFAKANALEQKS